MRAKFTVHNSINFKTHRTTVSNSTLKIVLLFYKNGISDHLLIKSSEVSMVKSLWNPFCSFEISKLKSMSRQLKKIRKHENNHI